MATIVLAFGQAGGSDFSERLAVWQGGTSAPPAATSQAAPQAAPASPRLAESWSPRMAPPNYHGRSPVCALCGGEEAGHYPSGEIWGGRQPGYFNPGHSCGGYGDMGACAGGPWSCNTLVWAKFDVLLWWRQGRDLPPLVTTDPVTEDSTTAGILPDAEILFGGQRVGSDMQAGGRFDIGWWFDPRQCTGLGWRFFGLGKDSSGFDITSLQNPVLAIPFTDTDSGDNDALLVAFPGLRSGEINVAASSEVLGNDVYARFLLCRDSCCRVDFLTGWHFSRINDGLEIRSRSTITEVGGNIPVGTVTDVRDQFDAKNTFNGAILGLLWERQCGCWTTSVLARMSIGNMHEEAVLNGSTQIAVSGQTPQVTAGGLLTADTNIGTFSRDEFTAVTEVGLTLGYHWGPCTRLTVGYTFIYWNDVITAGDSIDTNIGGDRPQFAFRHSDYWVQGINLGFVREF